MNEDSKKIFSLFQLLESVERMVAKTYSNSYWIRAEMIKLNRHQQYHCYPEFVEKKGDEIIADIRGIIWASTFNTINERFLSVVGEPLKDGMKVVMLVKLIFSPQRGLSLNVLDIDPTFTLGDMMIQKTQVLEKLKKEGLLNKNKLLPAPKLPRRIAIVSVNSSKGYQDFTNVLSGFSDRYRPMCVLFTAVLQGEKAVGSIVSALHQIKDNYQLFDFVVIIRGGGSEVGLTCYDHYELAAEIADFPIPILTGIGHSTNETVSETVAWKNLITPTETAYHIIQYFEKFEKELQEIFEKIAKLSLQNIGKRAEKMQQLAMRLKWNTEKQLNIHRRNIASLQNNLIFNIEKIFSIRKNKIDFISRKLKTFPELILQKNRHQLEINTLKIKMSNPNITLQKGFSITRKNGKAVSDIHDIKEGDILTTELKNGTIESVVKQVKTAKKSL